MLSIAVCDDILAECALLSEKIEKMLKQSSADFIVKRFINGQELLKSDECFDIIFLDIKMPKINGMEIAEQIRKQDCESIIIFVTSAKEYVFEAYDVEAFHYLMKPVSNDKLKNVLNKAVVKIQDSANSDFLIISSDHQTKKILLKEILYIESAGRMIKLHCHRQIFETYKQIGDLEQPLSEKHFFRCHKSYIINMEYISNFDNTTITMENGDTVYLSRKRREMFQKEILSYMKLKGGIF